MIALFQNDIKLDFLDYVRFLSKQALNHGHKPESQPTDIVQALQNIFRRAGLSAASTDSRKEGLEELEVQSMCETDIMSHKSSILLLSRFCKLIGDCNTYKMRLLQHKFGVIF